MGAGRLQKSRARWLATFTLLLLAVSTAPVLADPAVDAPPEAEQIQGPDATDLQEGVESFERKRAAREDWLASAEATRQRQASRSAYTNLPALETQNLLRDAFAEQLKALDADPARLISDLEIEKTLSPHGARVSDGKGSSYLVQTPIPLEVEQPSGEKEPVDLALQDSPTGGFSSRSTLTDVHLPDSLGGSIQIGSELAVDLPGDDSAEAVRFGDKDLFFPNTDTATDTLVAPIAGGVEIFNQLRSPESPEQFRFPFSLPERATLRLTEEGSAEIVDAAGEQVAFVPTPSAVDAQGSDVPVALSIDGNDLVLDIAHPSLDVAYPILVDPAIEEHWEGWRGGLGYWGWQANDAYYGAADGGCRYWMPCWGTSLYTRSQGNSYRYNAYTYGQFVYTPPNSTSYVARAVFSPINSSVNGCFTNHPHGYVGLYNVYSGSWNSLGVYSPPSTMNGTYDTGWAGVNGARVAVAGIGTGGSSSSLRCAHDFAVGGALLYLDDPERPTINSVTATPSGWIGPNTPITITSNTSDPGLGIKEITLHLQNKDPDRRVLGCTGLSESPCPTSHREQFDKNAAHFDEGRTTETLTVFDANGDPTYHKAEYTWQMHIDYSPPRVTLDGQLATATREDSGDGADPALWEDLSLPVYNLTIRTEDGSNATDAQKRSGVRSIDVYIDDARTPSRSWSQSCPTNSCPMDESYALQLHDLSAGRHTLRVLATDFVGNQLERRIEFEYIPATGIKDEYVMQFFALSEDEEDLDAPELAVNIMNGNLVYHEQDVDVTGPAADLEVTRYYNTMLPPQQDTEWGDGWTLGQTPDLQPEPGQRYPDEAIVLDSNAAFEGSVRLPLQVGGERFDPDLQATVVKEANGGYELIDESGESATSIAFDSTGQAEALRTDGYAKVDYDYEAGEISEIAVEDPASTSALPGSFDPPPAFEPTFESSFGSYGWDSGEFNSPIGAAGDSQGNLLLADSGNNRIQKFDPDGDYLDSFGSYGWGNGELNNPFGVAVDSQDNVFVADTNNNRIQIFDSEGNYIDHFGGWGSQAGQFDTPMAIAVDSQDSVFVADTNNGRIQKFDSEGNYLDQFGSFGQGEGEFYCPGGIAFDPEGNIFVADLCDNRIQKFDPEGDYLDHFGQTGSGDGQFTCAFGIAFDLTGNILISDACDDSVQRFDPEGQFIDRFGEGRLYGPAGILVDERDRAWIADSSHSEVERWALSPTPSHIGAYVGAFGSEGSGEGELASPQATAVDAEGDLFVLDADNSRIQKLSPSGEHLDHFGSSGSGNGQLRTPTDIAIDPEGNVWVVDRGNNRVQVFDSDGAYLDQFGGFGSGSGKFNYPQHIAFDSTGDAYVTDTNNHRVQKFDPNGDYLGQFGSYGQGEGELYGPTGIAVDSKDDVLVADTSNDRVQRFDSEGTYLDQFSEVDGPDGQIYCPLGIAVDPYDNVLVADCTHHRVQKFNSRGLYVDQFGEEGSGEGQLSSTFDIASDPRRGGVWVTDALNDRVQEWTVGQYVSVPSEEQPAQDDPMVEVETDSGLVESLEGEEAGEHTYEHDGDLLTSHEGPEGESEYEYDGAGRMTRVSLQSGTTAMIAYHSTNDRVRSVTVDLAGSSPARTTYFEYTDSPRQTTVTPPDAPVTVYDIGNDGSVFRWWNTLEPPVFTRRAGNLYAYKGTLIPEGDHDLSFEAYSEEGIVSLQFIANGNQLTDEKTCEFDRPEIYCKTLPNEWVTHTGDNPPGILHLEVIATDRLGQSTSEKFWVEIPYTPPPPPDAPVAPKFADILRFREEFGLDLDLRGDEEAINNRIFNLKGAWANGDPVARATMDRWTVPLRLADVAELHYRNQYLAHDEPIISQWAERNIPSTYAGFYVDNRQGGKIHVGFTDQAAASLAALKAEPSLIAPDRIVGFDFLPQRTFAELVAAQIRTFEAQSLPYFTQVRLDVENNIVLVGTTGSASTMRDNLYTLLGQNAPVEAYHEDSPPDFYSRVRNQGVIRAGDRFWHPSDKYVDYSEPCTANVGTWEIVHNLRGRQVFRYFVLTAGHCEDKFDPRAYRCLYISPSNPTGGITECRHLGFHTRNGLDEPPYVDGAAIRLEDGTITPRGIYWRPGVVEGVKGVEPAAEGMVLASSGSTTDEVRYGQIVGKPVGANIGAGITGEGGKRFWVITTDFVQHYGDSGGPIWNPDTHRVVGLIQGGPLDSSTETYFQPLLPYSKAGIDVAGVLPELGFQPSNVLADWEGLYAPF
jgi:YD repeat-containing protein